MGSYRIREEGTPTRPLPLAPPLPPTPSPLPAPRLAPPTLPDVIAGAVGIGVVLLIGALGAAAFTLWVLVPLIRGVP